MLHNAFDASSSRVLYGHNSWNALLSSDSRRFGAVYAREDKLTKKLWKWNENREIKMKMKKKKITKIIMKATEDWNERKTWNGKWRRKMKGQQQQN